jgi:SAM-dependent methyltransferase
MRAIFRRGLRRVTRVLLKPLEDRADALHQQLLSRFERLEKRMDSAVAKSQAEARLLAARIGAQPVAPRGRRLGGRIPQHAHELAGAPARTLEHAPPDLLRLSACSVCGHDQWTEVCEYNRFLLSGTAPDEEAMQANYALCHRCGVVFAKRRPVAARFRYLLEHFEETIGRARSDVERGTKLLGSQRLSEAETQRLRARAAHPVFVSEFPRTKDRQHLPQLLRDRLAVAAHVEILGSLLELDAPRVLEIRPRFGALGAALRRTYGGDTLALPLFEAQQLLVREVYHTRADFLLDYDAFEIPYEGRFDLIVANHLLTHAVRPADALAAIRTRLAPGGHLYLYNEPDEKDFLETGKSIFNTLNAFHLQTFDSASLARALQSAGFEPVFIGHHHDNCIALVRPVREGAAWSPIPKKDLARRIAKYSRSRDLGILSLPEEVRGRFASEWDEVVERAFAARLVDFDADGRLRLVKQASEPNRHRMVNAISKVT